MPAFYPHVLGIDDGPFTKPQSKKVPIVGVMMEGASLVEAIFINAFPVDGDDVTSFLADWIIGMRHRPSLQAVVLGGITIAGLGVIDITEMADRLALPVISVTRKDTTKSDLHYALVTAGLTDRLLILDRSPASRRSGKGIYLSCAGIEVDEAERVVLATLHKALVPEPLRLAHLFATAMVRGASQGRV